MTNEHSPRPWRITHPGEIEDANGKLLYNLRDCIGGGVDEANAALIVNAVNNADSWRDAYIKARTERNAFLLERDRLRDIVKRIATLVVRLRTRRVNTLTPTTR